MLENTQIDADGATVGRPQGRLISSPPASNLIVEEEADIRVPQGQNTDASLDELCGDLMGAQRARKFAIRQQSRCDRAVEAYIRNCLGFTTDPTRMSEADRKKIAAQARKIKNTIEAGTDLSTVADEARTSVIRSVSMVVLRNMVARQSWDDMRRDTEKQMIAVARQLPGWEFVKSVKGVGELGLAVIVGEAGDLSAYPKKGHLWKRLGLAVLDGRRQGNPGANATAEDWIRHGYKASRRAEVYAFIDDVMLRHQWRGPKDDRPGYPIGPYGEHYARKKAEYLIRYADEKDGKAHAENGARRYMAKMFIRDLWKAWRGAVRKVPQGQSAAAPLRAAA